MRTFPDCFPCYLQQALRVARLQGCTDEKELEIVKAVSAVLASLDPEMTPPANAVAVYGAIARVTGCDDPYLEVKRRENQLALERLPQLREEVLAAEEPLRSAISFAIAGNIIDYGTANRFDLEQKLEACHAPVYAVDHRDELVAKIKGLPENSEVLYLADNCGEIVYDSLLVELLADRGLKVVVAVKKGPIINDALVEDAVEAGIGAFAHIITNGSACPGTPLTTCSDEFLDHFRRADLILSKGQGNFETLSETDREIFFLLTVKCKMVGKHLADISGSEQPLPGNGEMVVYHSMKK